MAAVTLLLLAWCSPACALLVLPMARGVEEGFSPARGVVHRTPLLAAARMQVEAPVKIPDKVPNFAPAQPGSEKANQRGKKFKLLLFNDNVNK